MENAIAIFYISHSDDGQVNHMIKELQKITNQLYIIADTARYPSFEERAGSKIIRGSFKNRIDAYCFATDLLQEEISHYEKTIYCDNSFWGPFIGLDDMVSSMGNYSFWTISQNQRHYKNSYEIYEATIDTSFMCVIGEDKIYSYLISKKCGFKSSLYEAETEFLRDLIDKKIKYKTYIDYSLLHSDNVANNVNWLKRFPCTMLKDFGSPIMKKECICKNDFQYGNSREIIDAINYVKNNTTYSTKIIWNYLLRNYDISDLISILYLRYVIPDILPQKEIEPKLLRKCAVIIHMSYVKIVEKSFEYIKNIPEDIDVYITCKGKECIQKVQREIENSNRTNCRLLLADERGRDISALLITSKHILQSYEYICFLHDNKTGKNEGPAIIGENNMWDRWDNMIGSSSYVRNIIKIFEENDELGLMLPPVLYCAGRLVCLETTWGGSYQVTAELAKRLNLHVDISRLNYNHSVGTSFWCRTAALRKLFDANIALDDFMPEPMAKDGTFSHAVERIFPYVAQDAGYYTAIVEGCEYASRHIGDFNDIVNTMIGKIEYPFKSDYCSYIEKLNLKELGEFVNKHKKIYIYGHGKIGLGIANILKNNKWKYESFIVSDDRKIEPGSNVIYLSQISDKKESVGIVVGLGVYNQREVIPELKKAGFKSLYIV